MPSTVVMTSVVKEPNDGRIRVIFEDGTVLEYGSFAEMTEDLSEIDSDVGNTQRMALGWILARNSTLDNIAAIAGKNFTFDLSDPNAIKVQ